MSSSTLGDVSFHINVCDVLFTNVDDGLVLLEREG